jgi:hypothetical protein
MPLGGLMTAGLIVGAASGATQVGLGIADASKGKRTLKQAQSFYEQNKFDIPESAQAALSVAERQGSSMRLPGEDIARSRLEETVSGGIGAAQQAATSSSDVLALLGTFMGQKAQSEQNLIEAGAQRYDANQLQLQNALGMMSELEQKRWQYNVLYPYQQQLAQAEAYSTRGRQELSGGLSALGSMAGGMAQVGSAQGQYNNWMANMGFTMGDLNPQNRMQPMGTIGTPSLSSGVSTNQLMPM